MAADKVKFGPCVTNPRKIIGAGLNCRRHATELGWPLPPEPKLFTEFKSALNSHNEVIAASGENTAQFDYEAEFVIAIGKTAFNVSEADAPGVVFGYCTGNDFNARELKARNILLGKALDGAAPIGPWLVASDLADRDHFGIECRVNGELR